MIFPNCATDGEYSQYINIWLVLCAIQHVACSIERTITCKVVDISMELMASDTGIISIVYASCIGPDAWIMS